MAATTWQEQWIVRAWVVVVVGDNDGGGYASMLVVYIVYTQGYNGHGVGSAAGFDDHGGSGRRWWWWWWWVNSIVYPFTLKCIQVLFFYKYFDWLNPCILCFVKDLVLPHSCQLEWVDVEHIRRYIAKKWHILNKNDVNIINRSENLKK